MKIEPKTSNLISFFLLALEYEIEKAEFLLLVQREREKKLSDHCQ